MYSQDISPTSGLLKRFMLSTFRTEKPEPYNIIFVNILLNNTYTSIIQNVVLPLSILLKRDQIIFYAHFLLIFTSNLIFLISSIRNKLNFLLEKIEKEILRKKSNENFNIFFSFI